MAKFNTEDWPDEYVQGVKDLCRRHTREDLEKRERDIDEYFQRRAKEGWPHIKTNQDLILECKTLPLIRHCLQYLDDQDEAASTP